MRKGEGEESAEGEEGAHVDEEEWEEDWPELEYEEN